VAVRCAGRQGRAITAWVVADLRAATDQEGARRALAGLPSPSRPGWNLGWQERLPSWQTVAVCGVASRRCRLTRMKRTPVNRVTQESRPDV